MRQTNLNGRWLAIGTALWVAAGAADAGEITAIYDLAGSTVETTSPLGTYSDPMTGTITLVYDVATEFEIPSVGAIQSGSQQIAISQPLPTVLTLTGTTDSSWGSVSATLSGATLVQTGTGVVNTTGFLHCFGALCSFAGFTASVPDPQTQTGPLALPPLVFTSGNAGVGDFFGTGTTVVTSPAAVTVVTNYVATEISRVFVPEPSVLPMLGAGIVCLAGLGARKARQRR